MILGAPYSQLLPMFTEDILKVSATDMGILIAVSGVGAIIGSFILASLTNRQRGMILLSAGLVMGIALGGLFFLQLLVSLAVANRLHRHGQHDADGAGQLTDPILHGRRATAGG